MDHFNTHGLESPTAVDFQLEQVLTFAGRFHQQTAALVANLQANLTLEKRRYEEQRGADAEKIRVLEDHVEHLSAQNVAFLTVTKAQGVTEALLGLLTLFEKEYTASGGLRSRSQQEDLKKWLRERLEGA